MKNIIFLAPPAAGKGTCSDILKNTYDCEHISTGAILRSEIASQSSLGKEIKEIIDAGKLVSDDYMIKLIEETLSKLDKPFILDGFPRTINQAQNLSILFDKLNISNYIVIYLNIDKELALKRTLGRVTCEKCGRSYNIFFDGFKPKEDGICDDCKTALTVRGDDNEESFKVRFDTYVQNTLPIIEYYKNLNKLVEIDVNNKDLNLKEKLMEILSD